MKDTTSLHLKVQEMCDCYSTTEPLKEMSMLIRGKNTDEAAIKWIALTILHGINNNASEISISSTKDGDVSVTAEYRKTELPSPGYSVGQKAIQTIRKITHLEGKKGKTPLAVGICGNSIELEVKSRQDDNKEKVTIFF